MERRDYLLRQIEALGRILSRLRELIAGGATADATAQIREEMRNVGLELDVASAVDPGTLRMLLGAPNLDARRAFAVASLLHLDALRARADGDRARADRSDASAIALLEEIRSSLDGERRQMAEDTIAEIRGRETRPIG